MSHIERKQPDGSYALATTSVTGNTISEIYDDGTYTYICKSDKGSAIADAVWTIQRISNATGSSRLSLANQVATNVATVAALTYS